MCVANHFDRRPSGSPGQRLMRHIGNQAARRSIPAIRHVEKGSLARPKSESSSGPSFITPNHGQRANLAAMMLRFKVCEGGYGGRGPVIGPVIRQTYRPKDCYRQLYNPPSSYWSNGLSFFLIFKEAGWFECQRFMANECCEWLSMKKEKAKS